VQGAVGHPHVFCDASGTVLGTVAIWRTGSLAGPNGSRLTTRAPGDASASRSCWNDYAGGGTGAFAIPLALDGYDVTLLDASPEWLEAARGEAARSGTALQCVLGSVEDASELIEPSFDAILCHAVLMYVDDPEQGLHALRSVASPGALLSLLEKNRDGIALRPGLEGEYREARRLLVEAVSTGRLGIPNRARSVREWQALLSATGWSVLDWAGVRLFSDTAPDDLREDVFEALLDLERSAGTIEPYRSVARLVHVLARAVER
jgi:S-adenosylmethionine-dependent methyltransferase